MIEPPSRFGLEQKIVGQKSRGLQDCIHTYKSENRAFLPSFLLIF